LEGTICTVDVEGKRQSIDQQDFVFEAAHDPRFARECCALRGPLKGMRVWFVAASLVSKAGECLVWSPKTRAAYAVHDSDLSFDSTGRLGVEEGAQLQSPLNLTADPDPFKEETKAKLARSPKWLPTYDIDRYISPFISI
jgi:hypothetical protein